MVKITRAKDQPPQPKLPNPPKPPKCISCLCDHGGHEDVTKGVCTHHQGLFSKYKKCQKFLNS